MNLAFIWMSMIHGRATGPLATLCGVQQRRRQAETEDEGDKRS